VKNRNLFTFQVRYFANAIHFGCQGPPQLRNLYFALKNEKLRVILNYSWCWK